MNHGDSVKVGLHLVYTRVPIGVILPRLISVESYQFRWRFLVLVLGPRRLVQHVTQSWKQLSNSKPGMPSERSKHLEALRRATFGYKSRQMQLQVAHTRHIGIPK